MRKRKQPCRHYRIGTRQTYQTSEAWWFIRAIINIHRCENCAHWKWQTHPYKADVCGRTNTGCPERYTCRYFRGAWAQMRKEAK